MKITNDFLRTIDWGNTSIGPMENWSQSLKSYVAMILALPTPAIIFWGSEHAQIYNDGYAAIMGPRHPRYFASTFKECWPETYPIFSATMKQILEDGHFIVIDREQITMTRHGFNEEAHFTFTFSPLLDDDGKIAGVYQPVMEVTEAVLRDRRLETLRVLTTTREDVLREAAMAFAANAYDIPLAAIYLWNETEQALRISSASGLPPLETAEKKHLHPFANTFAEVFASNEPRVIDAELPATGPWPEPVRALFVMPIRRTDLDEPAGVIAFGLSPRLRFDAGYREFLQSVAREIAANLAAQRAEEARTEWHDREQRTMQETARLKDEHARRMAAVFENAPAGIAVLRGPDHVFEVANPSYSALVGNRPLLGKPLAEALAELSGQGILELIGNVYRTGEAYNGRSVPITVVRADGVAEDRFFDFVYQAIPGADGKTESVMAVVFETTELSKARRDAEAASRAKDAFFAILGHELRNPLAPITTALQLMRLRGDTSLAPERNMIERQVAHITRLVDDLLDVSRITGGKVDLKLSPVELSSVVASAIEIVRPLLEQRRHHLDVDVAAHGLVVMGDATRLAQVVTNILNNAAKYTEPGGAIRITAQNKHDRVTLHVTDTGMGIAPNMIGRVFEPFAQDAQSLDRAQGGLGLGLAIVANLMKLHGGTASAHSAGLGRGSTFTIELPASDLQEAAPSAVTPLKSTRPESAKVRVLVVDDNEDAADMLGEALRVLGCEIRIANDGADALRVTGELAPDLALLDIGLPVMDGYELAGRLRETFGARLQLVAVTGYGQPSDRKRAADAGFDALLVKPVQLDVVAELVERCRESVRGAEITKRSRDRSV